MRLLDQAQTEKLGSELSRLNRTIFYFPKTVKTKETFVMFALGLGCSKMLHDSFVSSLGEVAENGD